MGLFMRGDDILPFTTPDSCPYDFTDPMEAYCGLPLNSVECELNTPLLLGCVCFTLTLSDRGNDPESALPIMNEPLDSLLASYFLVVKPWTLLPLLLG